MYGRRAFWRQLCNYFWCNGLALQLRWALLSSRFFPRRLIFFRATPTLRNKGKTFLLLLLIMVLLLMSWTFYGLERSFEPVISKVAEIRAKQLAVETINRVIMEKIVDNAEYQTLMLIHKDQQNRPVLIQPNLIKIEKLQATALLEINQALKDLSSQDFAIPLGVISGSKLLANRGPDINVSVMPMGTVDVEMVSEFKQAGINQTRHVLSLKVNTEIMVVVPFVDCQTRVVSIIPVADNIIIGPVPEVMMNLDFGGQKPYSPK